MVKSTDHPDRRRKGAAAHLIVLCIAVFVIADIAWGQPIPEEARRAMARGEAAVEISEGYQGYIAALREFNRAAQLAPEWADPYFNLGAVYEKIEEYEDAIRNLNRYLKLNPDAPDAGSVQTHIYKLEFKAEARAGKAQLIQDLTARPTLVAGGWTSRFRSTCSPASRGFPPYAFRGTESDLQVLAGTDFWAFEHARWVPAEFDGGVIRYSHTFLGCDNGERGVDCPIRITHELKVVSPNQLAAKMSSITMPPINEDYFGNGHVAGQSGSVCEYELVR